MSQKAVTSLSNNGVRAFSSDFQNEVLVPPEPRNTHHCHISRPICRQLCRGLRKACVWADSIGTGSSSPEESPELGARRSQSSRPVGLARTGRIAIINRNGRRGRRRARALWQLKLSRGCSWRRSSQWLTVVSGMRWRIPNQLSRNMSAKRQDDACCCSTTSFVSRMTTQYDWRHLSPSL